MGKWYKEKYYIVNKNEFDYEKAKEFADRAVNKDEKINNTYNTYKYDFERRYKNVLNGKLSENAVKIFVKEQFNYDLQVNCDIYEGVSNVDDEDFNIKNLSVDVKSSKDNNNKGIDYCIEHYNFQVPKLREPRDIIISVLFDYNEENWYIVSWIDKLTYKSNAEDGFWQNEQTEWFKYSLQKGYSISDLKMLFDSKNKFIEFIKNNKDED